MHEIQNKLNELRIASKPYNWKQAGASGDGFDAHMRNQERILDQLKALARAKNTIVGREIRFPMADSFALYVITKVTKKTATVEWVKYCDGWQDDRLGVKGTLPIEYARNFVENEDFLETAFKRKGR